MAPKKSSLSKPTDMTIHWKALEEHFLMNPAISIVFPFMGRNAFSLKPQPLKERMIDINF
jgi:hypothetical protein